VSPGRARETLARAAYREWGGLAGWTRAVLAHRQWRALRLTLVSVALICVLQLVQHEQWGIDLVNGAGEVNAALPWWKALPRTPLSLFVPAPDLPVWGAAAQVLVVFGLAEITLGVTWTLSVAYASSLTGTLYARWGVAAGPHALFGLGPGEAFVRDTGPSAAVVALAVFVAWRHRAWWTGGVVVGSMVLEGALRPNLAGWEHLAALAAAAGCCAVDAMLARLRGARARGRPQVRAQVPAARGGR
jgi:hypothetical protein